MTSIIVELISDFALIILALMSLIALFFDEVATGAVLLFFILAELAVGTLVCYRMEIFFASLEKVFLPRCRVVREGRLYSVDPRHVVRGDIILVRAGDILPCDARLITSDALKVDMLVEKDKHVMLEKHAEGSVGSFEHDVTKYVNMIHAGSTVLSGSARAVVTDVGVYTYIGARLGGLATLSSSKSKTPHMLVRLKKWFSSLSVILLITTLPFCLFSMILGGDRLSLFSVFMTSVSLSALAMAMFAATLCKIFYAIPIRKCAATKNFSVIRSADALERLARTKYLFVLDGGALTDGVLHFERAILADGEFTDPKKKTASTDKLSEAVALYLSAKKNSLSTGAEVFARYDRGIEDFAAKLPSDMDALNIRCAVRGLFLGTSSDPHDRLIYSDSGEKYILTVSYSDDIITECVSAYSEGSHIPTNEAFLYSARETFKSFSETGKRVAIFSVARDTGYGNGTDRCFIGMIVLGEYADSSAEGALEALRQRGVRTVFFKNIKLSGGRPSVSGIPAALVGKNVADRRDFLIENKPVTYGIGQIDCYKNFSDGEVCELIGAIHKSGDTVAVMGLSEKFERIYKAADLTVTVSSERYALGGGFDDEIKTVEGADELTVTESAQTTRTRADIIVPRPDGKRGGVASLLGAHRASAVAISNIWEFFKYLLVSQCMRIVLARTPTTLGGYGVDSRHIFLCGVVSDLIVLFLLAFGNRAAKTNLTNALEGVLKPIKAVMHSLIAFVGGAIAASLLPELLSLLPFVPAFIDRTEYAFVTLMLLQGALFVALRLEAGADKIDRRIFILPTALVILCAICFIGGISRLFDLEGFSNIIYLLITPIVPLISVVVDLVLYKRGKKARK